MAMLKTRYAFAAERAEGRTLLEVACGAGQGLGVLQRRAKCVVAGDYTPQLVRRATDQYERSIPVLQLDAQHLPFLDATFDLVALFEAVYYLPSPEQFVSEAHRVLKPSGELLICAANPAWPGFNRSPLSYEYFAADELRGLLKGEGFACELFAGFPAAAGKERRWVGMLRQTAVRLHLIPGTMRGKELLKRVFYGRLEQFPAELSDVDGAEALVPISSADEATDYKVLYAVGRKSSLPDQPRDV